MAIEIRDAIDELPQGTVFEGTGKYMAIWDRVRAAQGKWVPVECETLDDARGIQWGASTYKSNRKRLGLSLDGCSFRTRIDKANRIIYIALRLDGDG